MKVAIAGYGVEGEANYKYWLGQGADVTIVDENDQPARPIPEGAKVMLGENVFSHLDDYDLVVRTASLPPNRIKTKGKIWSATNEFFDRCRAPIIGVTGTKGKGTTSSLIASVLEQDGYNVHLVGNIGRPAISALGQIYDFDPVVIELSSFQLWDLEYSPHAAVVLTIEPDHLDIHADFKDYLRAKSNIRRHQDPNGVCFYHPTNKYSAKIARCKLEGELYRYGIKDDKAVYAKSDGFYVEDRRICPLDALQLPGKHNIENACAAISAARLLVRDEMSIEKGLKAFKGLDHRLKLVREVGGVRYYDDSIATTPGSATAAIKAFDEPKVIMLGGSDKGAEYREIIELCAETKTKVIAIGQTGELIARLCQKHGVEVHRVTGLMDEAVKKASQLVFTGGVVILSPASASFDQYENYADRGNQFARAVQSL